MALGVLFSIAVFRELSGRSNPLRSLFPSDDAANVHAVIEPDGEVERTVILSAHHDTAAIQKTEKGKIFSLLSLQTAAIGYAVQLACSAVQVVVELLQGGLLGVNMPHWLLAILLIGASAAALFSVYAVSKAEGEHTSGAGDNLSGVSVVATLGRYFSDLKRSGSGLSSTRIVLVSFDGEECGAEGSAVWYRDSSHILINPININFDGLYSPDDLAFLSADGNGLVPLSSSLASRCSQIATGRMNGLVVRIYGSEGSLEWEQHFPDYVKYTPRGKATEILSKRNSYITEAAHAAARIPSGHPEGYYVAFANTYRNILNAVAKKKAGEKLTDKDLDFPKVTDGLNGVKFVHAVIESSKNDGAWVSLD